MKILISGDFVPINRGVSQVKNGTAFNKPVLDVINNHDLRIINLEAPVCEPEVSEKIIKDGPHLCTPVSSVKFLSENGFNCVTLANNHFYDYGTEGVKNTLEAVQTYMGGVKIGGGSTVSEQLKPLSFSDEKIMIFNYCESESSVGHEYGSNRLDPITAFYHITEAKKNGQFVIVICHGGHEGFPLPSPRMKSLFHFFVDCGANVVINHHQHCYSGYEKYNGSIIFYGLGNFYFDAFFKNGLVPKGWNEGYMVSLDISNQKLLNFEIIPYEQCKNKEPVVRLMSEDEANTFLHKSIS